MPKLDPIILPTAFTTLAATMLVSAMRSFPSATSLVSSLSLIILLWWFHHYPFREYTRHFRNVRGPKSTHYLLGNESEITTETYPNEINERYFRQYGATIKMTGVLGSQELVTCDPLAVGHILTHDEDWVKPQPIRQLLSNITGEGVLTVEHDPHRRQRRVLNPAFSPVNVRNMSPIFWDKVWEMQAKLVRFFEEDGENAGIKLADGRLQLDMQKYNTEVALDIIGLAGFDYDFNAIAAIDHEHHDNELAVAFHQMFTAGVSFTPFVILQLFFPILYRVPTRRRATILQARSLMERVGQQLIDEKKAAIEAQYSGLLEKTSDVGRDLLSLIIKANMAMDLRPDQRLTDTEVIDQISTFMVAGNETSSTGTSWALHLLSTHPEVQARLRAEVQAVDDDRPSFEVLNGLPYLDKVLKEVLRLSGPVPVTIRQATKKTAIPLSIPIEGRDGTSMDSITVNDGTPVLLCFSTINKSKEIWGHDAESFNPDRFDDTSLPRKHVPGVYSQLMSFGGGPHNCIGYRFAIAEIKTMLFVLMRTFEFTVPPSGRTIRPEAMVVMRPTVEGEKDKGPQMPLALRLL